MRDGSFYNVRIAESEAAQNADLRAFHACRGRLAGVAVSAQVQHAVHHQVRVVRCQRLPLLARFARNYRARRARCRRVAACAP